MSGADRRKPDSGHTPRALRASIGVMAGAAEISVGIDAARCLAAGISAEAQELARRATFARLVRGEAEAALGVARRLVGDVGEAEDLVQEAFLRAWRQLERLKPDVKVRPWFYRILINAGRDHLRRRKVRRGQPRFEPREPSAKHQPDPASAAVRRDLLERVQVVVAALPLRQRECLLLRARAKFSTADVAELLGISEGVVKGHLVHARRKLMQHFGPDIKDWGLTR